MSRNTLDHPYHQSRIPPAVHTTISLLSYHHLFDVVIHLRRLRFFFRLSHCKFTKMLVFSIIAPPFLVFITLLRESVVFVFILPAVSAPKVPSGLARPFCPRPQYPVSQGSIASTAFLSTYLNLSMMVSVLLII